MAIPKLYGENIIPIMTSNSTLGYTSSASSYFGSGNDPFVAFNESNSEWATRGVTGWIAIMLRQSKKVEKYSLLATTGSTITAAPKNWTFEGSNDGTNWTVLDKQNNQIFAKSEKKNYEIENQISYTRYRLNITANSGYSSFTLVGRLELYERAFYNKFLISLEDNHYSVSPLKHSDSTVISKMTSNTAPSGVASASSTNSPSFPYRAFDGDASGTWYATASFPITLQYEFAQPRLIGKYSLIGYTTENNSKTWKFEGSNDGVHWITLDEQINQINWTLGEVRSFSFKNTTSFKIYRINISSNNGGSIIQVAELLMYEILEFPKMKFLDTMSELNFLNYGRNTKDEIDMHFELEIRSFQNSNNSILGSGKIFKHNMDRSKHQVHKIILG
ncbi:discoidin domain-containing protein [Paenibacillus sp. FSL K6-4396]|uniref:discoidin domain-containing protein n=1 Tax=unclassified Paenibacillus TaxID=185978 RepID=UPI00178057DB|nr:discoidin domain-containing protein [Paenibacillus sp. CFBP 13594]MBD8840369.1 discoidin domain-containing protein [Paenibacillus sp. CFBP 13594]